MAWIRTHGIEFHAPTYYLAKGPPRIQPVGGGATIVHGFSRAAQGAGVAIRYGCVAQKLASEDGRISGVQVGSGDGATIPADAVILAAGGFQGNAHMMREHFGPGGDSIRLIAPGTRFNTGEGIRMALEQGADAAGEWSGMHSEPIDPRSQNSAPVVLVYPYGIVVDRNGRRFFDEGGGLVHETWETFSRRIHFETPVARPMPSSIAACSRSRTMGAPSARRSSPDQADTLAGLATLIGVDPRKFVATVKAYNAAATGDPALFDATRCDGLAASRDLRPRKSNWARAIDTPPFLAYPLIGAVAYTFGGIATNEKAQVLRRGRPIPVSMPPARSPGISTAPLPMRFRSCAPSCSAESPGARR